MNMRTSNVFDMTITESGDIQTGKVIEQQGIGKWHLSESLAGNFSANMYSYLRLWFAELCV
jgi:hypothetical protein